MTVHPAILVGAGGAVGTTVRFLLSSAIPDVGGLPLGTLLINLSGAFVLGWLLSALGARGAETERRASVRLFFGTGILGGDTTYRTLAVGSFDLVSAGSVVAGGGYALVTVVLGAALAAAGILLGRRAPMTREGGR